jgi:hypothetical protein
MIPRCSQSDGSRIHGELLSATTASSEVRSMDDPSEAAVCEKAEGRSESVSRHVPVGWSFTAKKDGSSERENKLSESGQMALSYRLIGKFESPDRSDILVTVGSEIDQSSFFVLSKSIPRT